MSNPVKRRILVVDDNVDSAETLAALLRLEGHDAHAVHDGERALVAARDLHPDLILLDIGLPGVNGYEVARQIRDDVALAGVRLIAVSGYGRAEDVARARAAGFDRHLAKPLDCAVLLEFIARP